MLTFRKIAKIAGVILCISMITPVFAESAPVYDADAVQDDGSVAAPASDQQADNLPPPPAPSQDANGTFIPVQPTITNAPPVTALSISDRMQRIEQQMSNLQNSDSVTRVDSLQDQVQTLRGQVEQLTHQLQQLQNQQKAMAETKPAAVNDQAADNPANDLPVATPSMGNASVKPVSIKTSKAAASQPNMAEEQQIYQTAYNLIKAKKYNDAVLALQGMLKKYPTGQFASNAHYWLGELYGLMAKNDLALAEFKLVVEMYPDSPRVSDAQLKVGLLLASQSKWPEAKLALKKVINRYPGTPSARLAAEQLKQIKIAGH